MFTVSTNKLLNKIGSPRIYQVELVFEVFRNPFQEHTVYRDLGLPAFIHKFKGVISCHL